MEIAVETVALALVEFGSIAAGMHAGDAMAKKAPIARLVAGTVHPGKYLVLISGAVADVDTVIGLAPEPREIAVGRGDEGVTVDEVADADAGARGLVAVGEADATASGANRIRAPLGRGSAVEPESPAARTIS